MTFNPDPVAFNQVIVGSSDIRTVTVRNEAGESGEDPADLVINGFEVEGPAGAFAVSGIDTFPVVVAPGEGYDFQVIYTAQSTAAATGRIVFDANSEDNDDEVLELSTLELACRLYATPTPLDMGRVPGNETKCETVTVQNIGTSNCTVSNYQILSASGEFSVPFFSEIFPDGPFVLEPAGAAEGADRFTIEVCYAPGADGFDRAALDIVSDSSENGGVLRVPITANGSEPCISVNHEGSYNFGPRLLGQQSVETFIVTNCSSPEAGNGEILEVSAIDFSDEVIPLNPAFVLVDGSVPQLPVQIDPGMTATFVVGYTPTALDVTDRVMLRINSNDEYRNPLDIEITGIGSNNECPTAIARCTIQGTSMPPSNEIAAIPLDTIVCNSEGSADPDGEIVEYLWEVLSQPAGSSTRFDTPRAASSPIFVDLAGNYTFQLTTTDNAGCSSPEPGIVTVIAVPNEDIHVQLVWDTPADPDQTDSNGADVDLHLLHPSGCWEDSAWDTHFRSVSPNWGDRTRDDDNPSLDIDDVDGSGPENINLDNPENGVTYAIGVHYWNDWGYGPSDATLRLYLNGSLVFQKSAILTNGQFWDVARVFWPSGEISVIDMIYGDIDAAPCR